MEDLERVSTFFRNQFKWKTTWIRTIKFPFPKFILVDNDIILRFQFSFPISVFYTWRNISFQLKEKIEIEE